MSKIFPLLQATDRHGGGSGINSGNDGVGSGSGPDVPGETDSAYRDLGLDPDKLTVFNIATDKPLVAAERGGGGGEVAAAGDGSVSVEERRAKGWRWGRIRSKSRSRRQGKHGSSSGFFEEFLPPPLPDIKAALNAVVSRDHREASSAGAANRGRAEDKGKGKGKLSKPSPARMLEPLPPLPKIRPASSSVDAEAKASVDTIKDAPLPPLPQAPPPDTHAAHTAAAALRAKERSRRERRDLKASGDWLGVQGSDPLTGEPTILTPTDTVSSDATSSGARRLLAELTGRRRDAEAEYARALDGEARGRELVRDARGRAKLEKIERRKEDVRARRLGIDVAADAETGAAADEVATASASGTIGVARTLRQHGDQWSSLVEPNLSPIAQSVNSSTNSKLCMCVCN